MAKLTDIDRVIYATKKSQKYKENDFYSIRSLLGCSDWCWFYIILGGRDAGKSYAVMEQFLKDWKRKHIPFYWIRLNEASTKKLLSNKARKLVDADLYRKYDLDLNVKGNDVFDHGKKMCTVLALSTFYNDKGVAEFDKDFLTDMCMHYNLALDEFQPEKGQKKVTADICYAFVNQLENIVRDTKSRMRIFMIANCLEEASDILCLFNFIPEEFGRYTLKKKHAIIDYMQPTQRYLERRKGTVADVLLPNASTFTNKIEWDKTLCVQHRLVRPTNIIVFDKNTKFTIWDGNTIAPYNGEHCNSVIAMRPYLDLMFQQELRDNVIELFDTRCFRYKNLITLKKFQHEISLIKPRKA